MSEPLDPHKVTTMNMQKRETGGWFPVSAGTSFDPRKVKRTQVQLGWGERDVVDADDYDTLLKMWERDEFGIKNASNNYRVLKAAFAEFIRDRHHNLDMTDEDVNRIIEEWMCIGEVI